MQSPPFAQINRDTHSDWVRLRTLILLRWLAIIGQLGAITAADLIYGLRLELGLCYLVVGTSVVANLVAMFVFPSVRRLSESQAMLTLLFDVSQLAFLLFLTGGLNNPFAMLLLAPVTISATALQLRTTVLLGLAAIGVVTAISFVYLPLQTDAGAILQMPPIFAFGFWLAIVIGIVFLGLYCWRVASEIHSMADALLATQMALAREQKLTDLGGVVAAAAHELGTPLATIKLVSSELIDELEGLPDWRDDVILIRDQADRCRDILRGMGRAGNEDLHLRQAPLETVIREAAEPHQGRGKALHFSIGAAMGADPRHPQIARLPEIIHGVRNLVQNAVDFAQSSVWISVEWNDRAITLRITDDGSGFAPQVIGRIGDPFVRSRRSEPDLTRRPEYEGMGLGLFIAKTLLERSGATLTFANGADPFLSAAERPEQRGAIVEVVWPKDRIARLTTNGLGKNVPVAI